MFTRSDRSAASTASRVQSADSVVMAFQSMPRCAPSYCSPRAPRGCSAARDHQYRARGGLGQTR